MRSHPTDGREGQTDTHSGCRAGVRRTVSKRNGQGISQSFPRSGAISKSIAYSDIYFLYIYIKILNSNFGAASAACNFSYGAKKLLLIVRLRVSAEEQE